MAATTENVQYVIYRVGANSANQPLTDRVPVGIVEAAEREAAKTIAAARWTAYANQWFDPVPATDVDDDEYAAAQEANA